MTIAGMRPRETSRAPPRPGSPCAQCQHLQPLAERPPRATRLHRRPSPGHHPAPAVVAVRPPPGARRSAATCPAGSLECRAVSRGSEGLGSDRHQPAHVARHRPGTRSGRGRRGGPTPRPRRARPARTGRRRSARTSAVAPGPCSPEGSTRWPSPRTTAARGESGLAQHQVGGRGDLVGDRRRGHLQHGAVGVGATRQVDQGGSPAQPTAMSVWPSRHARPAVSVTTTATRWPVRAVEPGAAADGPRRRGRAAAARRCPARCWRRRHRQRPAPARAGCAPRAAAHAGQPRGRSRRRSRRRGSATTTRPSALATALLDTHDDVAVGQALGRRERGGQQTRPGRHRPRAAGALRPAGPPARQPTVPARCLRPRHRS